MSHLLTRIVMRKMWMSYLMTKAGRCAMLIITWQVSTEETANFILLGPIQVLQIYATRYCRYG